MSHGNKSGRLTFIDETRALAIGAMMLMHFGPGVIQRMPALEPIANLILVAGRFATPAFIVVFGITAGFVYAKKFREGAAAASRKRIHRRAALVLAAAAILVLPRYTVLADAGTFDFKTAAYASYSVLSYYVLGLLTLPLWLKLIAKDPMRRAPLLGLGMWLVHLGLNAVWPHDPGLGVGEWIRMHLVSGSYPYFAMTGVAMLAVPVGFAIRRAHADGTVHTTLARRVLPLGLGLTALGIAWGLGLGELSLQAILDATPKAPARPWYYLMFGGMTLMLLTTMAFAPRVLGRRGVWALYPLGLAGQAALEIYTSHAYVLPGLYWLDQAFPVRGVFRIALALAVFAGFCTVMLLRRHRGALPSPQRA